MSKLHHPALHLVCTLAIASGLAAVACTGSDDVDVDPETGGTGGSVETGGTSGGGTGGVGTGGTSGSGGSNTGGGGTGGAPVTPRCMTKSAVPGATLLDFEALTAGNGATVIGTSAIQIGTYVYVDPMDTTATQMQALVEGYDATISTQAVSTTIHSSTWGGGMGLWFNMPGCLDATAFTGVSFWAKSPAPPATTPAGTVAFSLNMADTSLVAEGGTCATAPCTAPSYNFVVTETWTQFEVRWADFTAGVAGTTMVTPTGDNVTGLNFNLGNDNTARDIVFDLDDVAFLTD